MAVVVRDVSVSIAFCRQDQVTKKTREVLSKPSKHNRICNIGIQSKNEEYESKILDLNRSTYSSEKLTIGEECHLMVYMQY